jgi:hypothetical protein
VKRVLTTVALAVISLLALASPAAAAPARPDNGIVDAFKPVNGFVAGQLLGEEFRQLISLAPDNNPLAGNGNPCMSAGPGQKVLILFTVPDANPPANCTVKPGTPIFFSSLFAECSNVEAAPFFGKNEQAQRKCALDALAAAPFDAIRVTIDSGTPVNIGVKKYLAVSRQQTVWLPAPNILDVAGNRQATFVVAAYSALLRPLSPGTHTISVTIVGGQFAGTNRAIVNVMPGIRT